MARSTEAIVEPSILTWARATAGLSIEEAANSLQTKPEKVQAWEEGEESPSMAQLRKMATAYKRILSDFYLPAAPREEPLSHDSAACRGKSRSITPAPCATSSASRGRRRSKRYDGRTRPVWANFRSRCG